MKVRSIQNTENNATPVAEATAENESQSDFSSYLQTTNTLDQIFEEAASTYQVPKDLLMAIAKAESNFEPDATSGAGAQGIMQLMPATAKSLGVTDAYDPYQNIMGGAKFISQMLERYDGDVKLALAAYNAGPGNVSKYGGIPPFEETQNYVVKVMGFLSDGVSAPNVSYDVPGTHDEAYYEAVREDIFSYKDYLDFLDIYMSVQSEEDEKKRKEQEEASEKSPSYYAFQGIRYTPAVLGLIREGDAL